MYLHVNRRFTDALADIENQEDQLPVTEREAIIKSRIGQGLFRNLVLQEWNNCCSVTGCNMKENLKASHIKPWRTATNAERLDPKNGLLLVPNLDTLFDKGYISFDHNGVIRISKHLDEKNQLLLGVSPDMKLKKLPEDTKKYLEYHSNIVFKNE